MGRLIYADILKEIFSRNVVGGNAFFDLIDNAPTVEAIPKAEYEARLKADMVAMLTEIQLEIEELKNKPHCCEHYVRGINNSFNVIQQKINALKADRSVEDENHT